MKPLRIIPMLCPLIFALACGSDDKPAESADQGADDQQNAGQDQGGGQSGGQGQEGMDPSGGQQGGGVGGDPSGGGFAGGDPSGGGNPYGGQDPGFGGPPQQQQPTFDPNLPAGKKQVWTQAKIMTAYNGKSAADLVKNFGQPASWKKQGTILVYFYDKMYVKEKNMKYSQVSFAVQPDSKIAGGGKIVAVGLVPKSATRLPAAGGQGGNPYGGQGGFPGQGGGFPGQGDGEDPGGQPPQGFPGQGRPPQGYPGGNPNGR